MPSLKGYYSASIAGYNHEFVVLRIDNLYFKFQLRHTLRQIILNPLERVYAYFYGCIGIALDNKNRVFCFVIKFILLPIADTEPCDNSLRVTVHIIGCGDMFFRR